MTRFLCVKCGSTMAVGNWYNKDWYCLWCARDVIKPKPYEPPPPYVAPIYAPKEGHIAAKVEKAETKIEEIPCDNKL